MQTTEVQTCTVTHTHTQTLQTRLSTKEMMEFLKSVAAVWGRFVTSVMLSRPSGHMSLNTGSVLLERRVATQEMVVRFYKKRGYRG